MKWWERIICRGEELLQHWANREAPYYQTLEARIEHLALLDSCRQAISFCDEIIQQNNNLSRSQELLTELAGLIASMRWRLTQLHAELEEYLFLKRHTPAAHSAHQYVFEYLKSDLERDLTLAFKATAIAANRAKHRRAEPAEIHGIRHRLNQVITHLEEYKRIAS
jgi:hypothetical protein